MIDSLTGWNRNSVCEITGPESAGGCRLAGTAWAAGAAGGVAGACSAVAPCAKMGDTDGTAKSAATIRNNGIKAYTPAERWLINP